MKAFGSLTAIILLLGLLAAPAVAEMKPVLLRPVNIDGKYTDGITEETIDLAGVGPDRGAT